MINIKTPITLFAYNFPHKKTQDFIFRLLSEGYTIKNPALEVIKVVDMIERIYVTRDLKKLKGNVNG